MEVGTALEDKGGRGTEKEAAVAEAIEAFDDLEAKEARDLELRSALCMELPELGSTVKTD
jgi:hypothetical protein